MAVLVLITGTGRSGTSTMSGTLHHLGLHVPGPYLGANESNPKGFFESRWAVKFHKEITRAAGINDFDSRPTAFERAQRAITPELRARLRDYLTRESEGHDQVVVKDPRSVWAQALWRDVAAEAGLEVRYISMLRHPAEVVGSRTTYYASPDDEAKRRSYETFNVARWINSSIISERETRGQTRAFVSYPDLLADWRPVAARLAEDLGLRYAVDLAADEQTAVDEFIDPGLRRHQVTWDELTVPADLQAIAQAVWDDLGLLAAGHGTDETASKDLDVLGERYSTLFTGAADIAHDAIEEARIDARRAGAREARAQDSGDQHSGKQGAGKQGSGKQGGKAAGRAGAKAPRSLAETPVGSVGSRDLLRVVGQRARQRVRRRPAGDQA